MNKWNLITCCNCLLFSMLLAFGLHATPPANAIQTQNKLKNLDLQIHNLQHSLHVAHDKRGMLHQELARTEKQMGDDLNKLRMTQNNIENNEHKIAVLQIQAQELKKQLHAQQQVLANQLRALYQIGEYQPMKWLLNQDDPYKISRILTYYQYIIQSRQQLMERIDNTQQNLSSQEEKLHKELTANQQLKNELSQHQQQLQQNKGYHSALIQSLNQYIQNKENTLQEARKNKDNLTLLLKSLSQQSDAKVTKPFRQLQKKLPHPVQTSQHALRKMHQGVTFFAEEGTVVTAVYPGKVVFSDWLKGYGLLLIIDHGQGFMTLYAHNQSLYKNKGERVKQNEQIARVGHSGGIKQNGLYFEIRLRGKAIPPLSWLS